jgi:predicted aspartyl protease
MAISYLLHAVVLCLFFTSSVHANEHRSNTIDMYYSAGIYTIPVEVSNGGNILQTTVSFDTGASYSALPLLLIETLNLEPVQTVNGRLADGTLVPLTLYALPEITVGSCILTDTIVIGIDKERGILGMQDLEQLRRFTFEAGRLLIEC